MRGTSNKEPQQCAGHVPLGPGLDPSSGLRSHREREEAFCLILLLNAQLFVDLVTSL